MVEMGDRRSGITAAVHSQSLHSQLSYKRLEEGKFRWPRIADGVMRLSAAQLSALLEGLDWSRVHAPRVARPQAVQ
jgi:transposase